MTLQGHHYDGRHPIRRAAILIIVGQEAELISAETTRRCAVSELRVSPRVARAERFIRLPSGDQFQCADDARLDGLPQEVSSEGAVAWLEARLGVALTCIAIIAAVVSAGYFYGLPIAARHIVARIPIDTERALGRDALAWLDGKEWFEPTHIDPDRQRRLHTGFAELTRGLPYEHSYRLEFRNSEFIGANAFALPGGIIVVTDALVILSASDEEVLAILAHEIGHVEHHHVMRHVVQSSVAGIVAAAITADAASLGLAVTALPVAVAQARYSRGFESEADEFAFQRLKQTQRSPAAFAAIMERLDNSEKESRSDFLSSHPLTADRVARARAAAEGP